jgi:hypothetical protein
MGESRAKEVSRAVGESRVMDESLAMGVSAVELMVCARLLVFGMVGDERGSASSCLMWRRVDMLCVVSGVKRRLADVCLFGQKRLEKKRAKLCSESEVQEVKLPTCLLASHLARTSECKESYSLQEVSTPVATRVAEVFDREIAEVSKV